MATTSRGYSPSSLPMATLGTVVALVAIAAAVVTAIVIFGDATSETTPWIVSILGLVGTTVPALIAAGFAERAAKDIRNGVVESAAEKGAEKALDTKGVTAAATDFSATTPVALTALTTLLEKVVSVTEINTVSTDLNTHERKPHHESK